MTSISRWSQLVKYCATFAVASLLLLGLAAPLLPQSQGDNRLFNDNGGALSDFERQRRLDRDMEQRGSQMGGGARENTGMYFRSVFEIQKKTAKLRTTNGELQQAIQAGTSPDYKRIAQYASKIRSLASTLRSQLSLPKAALQPPAIAPGVFDEQLRSAVKALDRAVSIFLSNQAVQGPHVRDAGLRAKAARDVRELLTQSAMVKKLANTLRGK
jgi:hypothetical protein